MLFWDHKNHPLERGVGFVYEKNAKYQKNFFVKVIQNSNPYLKCNFVGKMGVHHNLAFIRRN